MHEGIEPDSRAPGARPLLVERSAGRRTSGRYFYLWKRGVKNGALKVAGRISKCPFGIGSFGAVVRVEGFRNRLLFDAIIFYGAYGF